MAKRRCKFCHDYTIPKTAPKTDKFCCEGHMIQWAMAQGRKRLEKARKAQERERRAETKERLKRRGDHLKEAQQAFNAFIRERDRDLPCVSCGKFPSDAGLLTGSKWDAGHYRSIGANPELRFDEDNCSRQCVKCNRELSGNIVNYRAGLLKRIGRARLEKLEGPHPPLKLSVDEIKTIKAEYREKLRELKREQAA